ncbi:hypothetical protein HanOQP8_Chr12g0448051 [Helianthus annuus]|nr:hypothetical protein HanOQP8_Chr12g0448051 [Helianthus annuus]
MFIIILVYYYYYYLLVVGCIFVRSIDLVACLRVVQGSYLVEIQLHKARDESDSHVSREEFPFKPKKARDERGRGATRDDNFLLFDLC